jgi:hypothetical protein
MTNTTDIWNELLAQKAAVLAGIGDSRHDNVKLRQLTEWIRRELDLESKHKSILSEAECLIAERQRGVTEGSAKKPKSKADLEAEAGWKFADLSKQERVKVARRSYFKRQEELGNHCEQVKGKTIYRRKIDGAEFGITFSIDKVDKGVKKWFLGLPKNLFQEAVLLCQCGPRSVKVIHLPKEFCEIYGKQLSVGKKGQVKFNILREGNKWRIEVPQPVGVLDVTNYADSDELVCSRYDDEFI